MKLIAVYKVSVKEDKFTKYSELVKEKTNFITYGDSSIKFICSFNPDDDTVVKMYLPQKFVEDKFGGDEVYKDVTKMYSWLQKDAIDEMVAEKIVEGLHHIGENDIKQDDIKVTLVDIDVID